MSWQDQVDIFLCLASSLLKPMLLHNNQKHTKGFKLMVCNLRAAVDDPYYPFYPFYPQARKGQPLKTDPKLIVNKFQQSHNPEFAPWSSMSA